MAGPSCARRRTSFRGSGRGRANPARRRSRLQHQPHGLPGSFHRPELCRAARLPDVSAHRKRGNESRRRGIGAAVHRSAGGARVFGAGVELAIDRIGAGVSLAAQHPGDLGVGHARLGAAPARCGRAARRRATDGTPVDNLIAEARALPSMAGLELASGVTCEKKYDWARGSIELTASPWHEGVDEGLSGRDTQRFRVVAYDFGIKQNILRLLVDHNCEVTVVPAKTASADVLAMKPDGVFLSNGPGDPEPATYAIEAIRGLVGNVPVFGICLGHQLCGLALGRKDLQIKIWAPRLESSGEKSADGSRGDHRAESRFRGGSGFAAGERRGNHAYQFERPDQRRHAPSLAAALLRAVSPGGVARAARFALFVPAVHADDE